VSRPAVFLDRDGTLIEDRHYIAKPEDVVLVAGAAAAVRRLRDAGFAIVVVSNQSGIARGYFTREDHDLVQQRFSQLLTDAGARLDGAYWCPHHPDFSGPCECRKPGTLLFREAAVQHAIDLPRSWYVGDRLRDILPAKALGGRGILVPSPVTPGTDLEQARMDFSVVPSLDDAATRIIESAQ
jgi:D-glycero-D-manno-heptose 1,7-bisphosphate phosphatase